MRNSWENRVIPSTNMCVFTMLKAAHTYFGREERGKGRNTILYVRGK